MKVFWFALFCFINCSTVLFAQGPVIDSSSVRYGLFAEYDGYFADLLGLRMKIDRDNTILGQFSFYSSLFDNDEMNNGNVTDRNRKNYSALIGFEHCLATIDRIDCQAYIAVKYSWSRMRQTEKVYTYDAGTNTSTYAGLASTEEKSDYYYLYAGIGLEYRITDQLSLELIKRFEYSRTDHYTTNLKILPGSSSTVNYGFEDVFMNIIYYF
jgi:hypothetical protein